MERIPIWSLCALAGSGVAFGPMPSIGIAAWVIWVLWRRIGPMVAVVSALCFGWSASRSFLALAQAQQHIAEARQVARPYAECQVDGVVVGVVELRRDSFRTSIEAQSLSCGSAPRISVNLEQRLVLVGVPEDTRRGDRLQGLVRLTPVELYNNPGTFPATPRVHRLSSALTARAVRMERIGSVFHPLAGLDSLRHHARIAIRRSYPQDVEALARALVLGESDLAPEDDMAFRQTGLSHLLAVSGTHLVIAVLGVVAVIRALLSRIVRIAQAARAEPIAAILGLFLTWAYAAFTGMTGSVFRAALMTSLVLICQIVARRASVLRVLSFTVAAGLVADPLLLFDISFMLSLSATVGLLLASRGLAAWQHRIQQRWLLALVQAIAATLAATLCCAPVLASISPTLPIIGVLLNLIAAPLGESFGLPLALAHIVLSWIPGLDSGFAAASAGTLKLLLWLARQGKHSGFAVGVPSPTAIQVGLLMASCIFAVGRLVPATLSRPNRRGLGRALIFGAAGILAEEIHLRLAPRTLSVTAIDVGQGDAILVRFPDGRVMLVDAGGNPAGGVDPGARAVAPMLRALRVSRVHALVLSHPHPDHYAGVLAALEGLAVDEVWDTGEAQATGREPVVALIESLRARGAVVRGPSDLCQAPQYFDRARVDVLAPCDFSEELSQNTNDNSFVLRVALGDRSVLLTGDAEAEAEASLIASHGAALRADLLKVGHHGSKTSSSEAFVAAVAPKFCFISCGIRNRFQHPHPRVLSTLEPVCSVCRTDLHGACTARTDGVTWSVASAEQ